MATDPVFASTPRIGMVQATAANDNQRDGTTGTYYDVITGVAAGTKIEEIVCEFTVTTTAGMIRLFLHDGTNNRLFDEIPVTAVTPTASVAAFRASRTYLNLVLPSASWKITASNDNAEACNIFAFGADLT